MLTFAQFLEAHPELDGMTKDEQLTEYELYQSTLTDSIDEWVLG